MDYFLYARFLYFILECYLSLQIGLDGYLKLTDFSRPKVVGVALTYAIHQIA